MNNPISILLLLAAAVLSAMLILQMENRTRLDKQVAEVPRDIEADSDSRRISGKAEALLPPRDELTATVTRPLFNPSRSPADETQRASEPNQVNADLAQDLELNAIVIDGGARLALVRNSADGEIARLRQGETIAGWQLKEIHSDRIVLGRGEDNTIIELRRFDQKPSPAQPRDNTRQPMTNPALRPMAPIRPMAPTNQNNLSGQETGASQK